LINNLFKTIVEVSVPNFVKYIFYSSYENKGFFEDFNHKNQIDKKKKLSKYQIEELKSRQELE